ncbi:MAG: hypothetical protein RLZZ512_1839, partial [Bacteroidota bacterium]
MGKNWIKVAIVVTVVIVGLAFWLVPRWYTTNDSNVTLTYQTPISDSDFDALIDEKLGVSTKFSFARVARLRGLDLTVKGSTTLVLQPHTSIWNLIKLLVRYQRDQQLVTILSHWEMPQFQTRVSKQFG